MNLLYQNILGMVGRTPILPLNRVVPTGSAAVLVKMENQNPSGSVKDRIVKEVDTKRFQRIAESTLEGLAKRELNLSALVGKSAEARERRLVPEVVDLNGVIDHELGRLQRVHGIQVTA